MTKEDSIVGGLISKFPFLQDKTKVQRLRRIISEVSADSFEEVFAYVQQYLEFSILCTITGLDESQTLGFIYHMARTDGIVLNLKFSVPKDKPVIKTMIKYFPNSDIYERELVDLFGARVEGLSEGNRYPLCDDWPKDEYPLRKDWKKSPAAADKRSDKGEGVKNA